MTPVFTAGFCGVSSAQVEPFQVREAVTSLLTGNTLTPTAVHDEVPVHDTELRALNTAPVTEGTVTGDQVVPLHCSTNEVATPPVTVAPTAVHEVVLGQATPLR